MRDLAIFNTIFRGFCVCLSPFLDCLFGLGPFHFVPPPQAADADALRILPVPGYQYLVFNFNFIL